MAKKIVKAETYRKNIKSQMQELGTYTSEFEILINALAETCYLRDCNSVEWDAFTEKTGYRMAYPYTNKGGATNMTSVPFYLTYVKLTDSILKYCKELGLSPLTLEKAIISEDEDDELDVFLQENAS